MLTPRKAAIIAVFILTAIYLLHNSHTPPRTSISNPDSPAPTQKPPAKDAPIPKTTGRPNGDSDRPATPSPEKERSRPYPPSRRLSPSKQSDQQPLTGPSSKPLRDQLAYQFPYDLPSKFPAYIWQTWKYTPASGEFSDHFRGSEASWTEKHPGFVHEVVTDEAAVYLMRHLYASVPQVVEAYKALPLPVLKADFFRYLILLARGGIYSDIDTTALQSTTDWLPKEFPRSTIGLIIGIEADPDREDWKAWFSRRIQFCQWTIQAKPGHPVLREIVASLTEEILQTKKAGTLKSKSTGKNVVEFTGPARWTDTVFDYLNDPRYFDMRDDAGSGGKVKNITWEAFTGMETAKKIGDVVVLPITSFSPGVQQMGAKEPDDPMAFVQHEFEGTWKPESERIHPEREQH